MSIKQKERAILLLSESPKIFDWFINLLNSNKEITDTLINSLDDKQKKFIQYTLDEVINQSILEWKLSNRQMVDLGEDESNWAECSFCNTPNRYLYFIENEISKKVINVGSTCVKEYDLAEIKPGQDRRKAKQLRNVQLLNENYPGIEARIKFWESKRRLGNLWIPNNIGNRYSTIGNIINDKITKFLSGKVGGDSLIEIKALIEEANRELEHFNDYVQTNSNKEFVLTQQIYDECIRDDKMLKENLNYHKMLNTGMINYEIANKITEPNFMLKTAKLIFEKCKDFLNKLELDINTSNQYEFVLNDIPNCKFYIPHADLSIHFSWSIFDQKKYSNLNKINFLKLGKIIEEDSLDLLLKKINSNLTDSNTIISGFDFDFNEIYLFNKSSNYFFRKNLNSFIGNYKLLALQIDNNLKFKLNNEIGLKESIKEITKDRTGAIIY